MTGIVLEVALIAGLLACSVGQAFGGAGRVEITEVKNIGVSAADEDKSIIQVKWTVAVEPGSTIESFDVSLEVTYADGVTRKASASVNGSARKARFEFPTLHFSPGRPGAALRAFKATVAAGKAEAATRQGSF
ncbi:MAG TPA: hypothetical protein VNO70_08600 [Blastocatellia bacterium]|nr:hypothetical protein [Blastocatellia bacterium]